MKVEDKKLSLAEFAAKEVSSVEVAVRRLLPRRMPFSVVEDGHGATSDSPVPKLSVRAVQLERLGMKKQAEAESISTRLRSASEYYTELVKGHNDWRQRFEWWRKFLSTQAALRDFAGDMIPASVLDRIEAAQVFGIFDNLEIWTSNPRTASDPRGYMVVGAITDPHGVMRYFDVDHWGEPFTSDKALRRAVRADDSGRLPRAGVWILALTVVAAVIAAFLIIALLHASFVAEPPAGKSSQSAVEVVDQRQETVAEQPPAQDKADNAAEELSPVADEQAEAQQAESDASYFASIAKALGTPTLFGKIEALMGYGLSMVLLALVPIGVATFVLFINFLLGKARRYD